MDIQPEKLIEDFTQVAALAGISITTYDIRCEILPAPHKRPAKLPAGKKVVYVFCAGGKCLKVGKAGLKSHARFSSQHYLPKSCQSNLAKSLLADLSGESAFRLYFTADTGAGLTHSNIGQWMEQHAARYHFFVDETQPAPLLSLLEIFLQCRLRPVFESGY